jgi:hypothetical protein
MSGRLVARSCFVAAVALFAALPALAAADAGRPAERETATSLERPRNVLLLYATPRLGPAVVALDEAFRSTLATRADGPVFFYTEYLDLSMFPDGEPIPELRALLKRKYGHVKLDLLIAASSFFRACRSSSSRSTRPWPATSRSRRT